MKTRDVPHTETLFDGDEPEDTLPCAVCRRPVKSATAKHWIRIINGGGEILHPSEFGKVEVDPMGDLGEWPVGPDCRRKFELQGWTFKADHDGWK